MTKKEFLRRLDKDLSVLSPAEKADIINEYEQHIDMEMAAGLTEAEAMEGFTPYEDFIANILEAYRLNPEYMQEEKRPMRIVGFFQETVDALFSLNRNGWKHFLKHFLITGLITFGILVMIMLIASTIEGIIFEPLFSILPHTLVKWCVNILWFIGFLLMLSVVIYAVYWVNTRYLFPLYDDVENSEYVNKETVKKASTRDMVNDEPDTLYSNESTNHKRGKAKPKKKPANATAKEDDPFINILVWIIRIAVFAFLLLPVASTAVILVVSTGGTIGMAFSGYPLIGVSFAFLGASLICIALTLLLGKLTFGNVLNASNKDPKRSSSTTIDATKKPNQYAKGENDHAEI